MYSNKIGLPGQTVNSKELLTADKIFDNSSDCIAKLVNITWLYGYLQFHHLMYNNRNEFRLHFQYLCKSYGIKHKPTSDKSSSGCNIGTCATSPRTDATHS
jgi:hypothetical protein